MEKISGKFIVINFFFQKNFFVWFQEENFFAYVSDDFKIFFFLLRKCSKNLVVFFAEIPLSANLFRLSPESTSMRGPGLSPGGACGGGRSSPPKKIKIKNLIKKFDKRFFQIKIFFKFFFKLSETYAQFFF